jgi:hypothetical protein
MIIAGNLSSVPYDVALEEYNEETLERIEAKELRAKQQEVQI